MMQPQEVGFGDAVVSLIIGGFLGWFAGGCYNVMHGKRWSGKGK